MPHRINYQGPFRNFIPVMSELRNFFESHFYGFLSTRDEVVQVW